MIRVTFVAHDGSARTVEAEAGLSVMEAATRGSIGGIEAECGGACACATCHVYVDEAWRGSVGEAASAEADMLEFASEVGPGSRLSCQIKLTPALDGLIVRTPARQG